MRPSDPDSALVAIAMLALFATGAALTSDESPFASPKRAGAPVIGEFAAVEGPARTHGAGVLVWSAVRTGDRVHSGDSVFTGADAQVTVRLADGSTIDVAPSTFLVVVGGDARPSVRLARGSVEGFAGMGGLSVETAGIQAELATRTHAAVHVATSGSRVEVSRGQAGVTTPGASERRLGERDAIFIGSSGGVRMARLPVSLSSPAAGATLRFDTRPEAVPLSWDPGGMRDLRLEVARDADFVDLALSSGVDSTERAFLPPSPGVYRWRLVDASRAQVSETRSFVVLEEKRPLLAQPLPDEVVFVPDSGALSLAWHADEPVHVQVASDPSFETLVFVRDAEPGNRIAFVPPPGDGRWLWRARGAREGAPWSEARPFRTTRVDGSSAPMNLNVEVHVDAP